MDNLEWKPSKAPDFQEVGRLSKDTGLNPLVASLLIQRGMGPRMKWRIFWTRAGKSCTTPS